MDAFVQAVIDKLPCWAGEGDDRESVVRAISDLKHRGWTPDEAVAKIQWMEQVNPLVSEEFALQRMRDVESKVALRLAWPCAAAMKNNEFTYSDLKKVLDHMTEVELSRPVTVYNDGVGDYRTLMMPHPILESISSPGTLVLVINE